MIIDESLISSSIIIPNGDNNILLEKRLVDAIVTAWLRSVT